MSCKESISPMTDSRRAPLVAGEPGDCGWWPATVEGMIAGTRPVCGWICTDGALLRLWFPAVFPGAQGSKNVQKDWFFVLIVLFHAVLSSLFRGVPINSLDRLNLHHFEHKCNEKVGRANVNVQYDQRSTDCVSENALYPCTTPQIA